MLSKNHNVWAGAVMRCKGGNPYCGADGYCHADGKCFGSELRVLEDGSEHQAKQEKNLILSLIKLEFA